MFCNNQRRYVRYVRVVITVIFALSFCLFFFFFLFSFGKSSTELVWGIATVQSDAQQSRIINWQVNPPWFNLQQTGAL